MQFTQSVVSHIATLANIPLTQQEKEKLATGFTTTMTVVEELGAVDTTGVEPTHQVTGLENVWREDTVDEERMFTQQQALQNAVKTHKGYIVVPQIVGE